MTPEEIFIRQSIAFARTLPFGDAVTYLRGMLSLCGDHDMTPAVRDTFVRLSHCDEQLELLASGQLKLSLP